VVITTSSAIAIIVTTGITPVQHIHLHVGIAAVVNLFFMNTLFQQTLMSFLPGNFYRIRGALKYGARKLGWILLLPRERIGNELKMFFSNTLDRHGSNCWTDIQNPSLASGAIGSDFSSLSVQPIVCSKDTVFLKSTLGFHDDKISGIEVNSGIRPKGYSQKVVSSEPLPEFDCVADRNAVIGCCFAGDATSGILSVRTNGSSHCLHSESNLGTLFLRDSHHATHFNSSGFFQKNGKIDNCNPCQKMPANSVVNDKMVSTLWPEVEEKHLADSNLVCSCINRTGMASTCSVVSSSVANVAPCNGERYITGVPGSTEALKCFLDLSGDYDSHLRNLQYAQLCHGYAVSPPLLPMPPMSHKLQNGHSQMSKNGVVLGPQFYSYPTSSCSAYGLEEKKKPRGTGTYFPKLVFLFRNYISGHVFSVESQLPRAGQAFHSWAIYRLIINYLVPNFAELSSI
jgi:hypothetical protein